MTDILEKHGLSLAEMYGLGEDSVLNSVHQRWFERTGKGDGRLIMLSFASRIGSNALSDTCVSLFDGYVARIGAGHLNEDEGLDEYGAYLVGRRTVRAYIESADPREVTINNIIAAIKTGYQADDSVGLVEQIQDGNGSNGHTENHTNGDGLNGNGRAAPKPARSAGEPRVKRAQRAGRGYEGSSVPVSRREALDLAFQKKDQLTKIRAGLRTGKIDLREALSSPHVERAAIGDILIRVPRVGKVTSRSTLNGLGIVEETEIGALSEEQKARLASMFPREKYRPRGATGHANRDQSMNSLKTANFARSHRASLKVSLAGGEITVEDLFNDPIGAGMKIKEFLVKLPARRGTDPKNVKSIGLMDLVLDETGLPGSKRCNELTERQKQTLLDCLADRYNEEKGTYTYAKRK